MGKIMFVKKIKISKAELNQRLRQAFLDGYNEGRKDGKRLCLGQKITVGMIKEYLNLLSNEENNNKTTKETITAEKVIFLGVDLAEE